jgi:hypothetical protein
MEGCQTNVSPTLLSFSLPNPILYLGLPFARAKLTEQDVRMRRKQKLYPNKRTVLWQAPYLLFDLLGALYAGPRAQGRVDVLLVHQLVDELLVDGWLRQALDCSPPCEDRVQGWGQQGLQRWWWRWWWRW